MSLYVKRSNSAIKELIILFFGYSTFAMFRLSLGVALPSIIKEMNINEFQAGLLYSIPLWSTAILLAPAGLMADRFGRKRVLSLGYLLLITGVLLFSFSPSYPLLAVSLAISGLGSGMIIPSYYSIMGDLMEHVRGLSVGFAVTSYQIGGFAGSYLTGAFTASQKWRIAFIIIGALQSLMLLVQAITIRSDLEKKFREKPLRFFEVLREKNILVSGISLMLGGISYFSIVAWLPLFLISKDVRMMEGGLILGLFLAAGAVSSPVFGGLSEKAGRKRTAFYLGVASAIIAAISFLLNQSQLVLTICSILLGVVLAPYWSILTAAAQESIPEENLSTATGIVQMIGLFGCALGPVISGALIPALGINYALSLSVILPSILFSLATLLIKEEQREISLSRRNK